MKVPNRKKNARRAMMRPPEPPLEPRYPLALPLPELPPIPITKP